MFCLNAFLNLCFLFGPLLYSKLSWTTGHWHFEEVSSERYESLYCSHIAVKVQLCNTDSSRGTCITVHVICLLVQTHNAQNYRPSSNKTRTYMLLLKKWPTSHSSPLSYQLSSTFSSIYLLIQHCASWVVVSWTAAKTSSPQSMMILIGQIHSFSTVFLHLLLGNCFEDLIKVVWCWCSKRWKSTFIDHFKWTDATLGKKTSLVLL